MKQLIFKLLMVNSYSRLFLFVFSFLSGITNKTIPKKTIIGNSIITNIKDSISCFSLQPRQVEFTIPEGITIDSFGIIKVKGINITNDTVQIKTLYLTFMIIVSKFFIPNTTLNTFPYIIVLVKAWIPFNPT